MLEQIAFVTLLVKVFNSQTVLSGCDHFGLYGCSQCSQTACLACHEGWFLMPYSTSSFCVPSCDAAPLYFNNPVTRECNRCTASNANAVCVKCHHGICFEEVTSADFTAAIESSSCAEGEVPTGSECSFLCGDNEFYDFTQKLCVSCHSQCLTCLAADSSSCTTCPQDHYLAISSDQVGSCLPKAPSTLSFTLYVSNDPLIINDGNSNQSRDGSDSNPFVNLADALRKADQLSAPYSGTSVLILLSPGIHFILLQSVALGSGASIYLQQASKDEADRDYSLTIRPLDCPLPTSHSLCHSSTDPVSIINKAGGAFHLKVPRSLSIMDLTFDSIDSVPSLASCTQRVSRDQTCVYDSTMTSPQALLSCSCQLPEMSANDCSLPHPNPLIQFDYNSAVSGLAAPKSLNIQRVSFINFYALYYNLIELPSEGADVQITQTSFSRISSCGPVIGNLHSDQLSFLYETTYSASSLYLSLQKSFLQRQLSPRFVENALASSYDPLSQSQLLIQGSSFSNLNFAFNDTTNDLRYDFVFPNYTHYLKAGALLLYKSEMPITIFNSSFTSNAYQLKRLLVTQPPQPSILKSALYSARSGLQVDSVLYSFMGQAPFNLLNNSFIGNGGSHGPVGIQLDAQNQNATSIIIGNQFTQNSGVIGSGALSLISKVTSHGNNLPHSCGSFFVGHNNFTRNSLFSNGGIMQHECSLISDSTFSHTLSLPSSSTQPTFNYTTAISAIPCSSTTVSLYGGISIEWNTCAVSLQNNTFSSNIRGSLSAVVLFNQSPYLALNENSFQNNGDSMVAGIASSLSSFMTQTTALSGIQSLQSQFSVQERKRALPLVFSGYTHFAQIINTKARDNWLLNPASSTDCASSFQFSYSPADHIHLSSFFSQRAAPLSSKPYLSYLNDLSLTYDQTESYLSGFKEGEGCPHFLFDHVSESIQIELSDISVKDQSFAGNAALISKSSFWNFSTSSEASTSSAILSLSSLLVEGITCTETCTILKAEKQSVSVQDAEFNSITIPGQGELIKLSMNAMSPYLLSSLSIYNLTAPDSSSLIQVEQHENPSPTSISVNSLFINSSSLPPTLISIRGSSDSRSLDFSAQNVEIESSTVQTLFKAESLSSFTLSNSHWEASSRGDLFESLLIISNTAQVTASNITLSLLQDSYLRSPAMSIELPSSTSVLNITDSTFKGVRSQSQGGLAWISGTGSVLLSNCTLTGNQALRGGVFFVQDQLQVQVSSSTIHNNSATDLGGAFYFSGNSLLNLFNSSLESNSAREGGVMVLIRGSSLNTSHSSFFYNTASDIASVGLFLNSESTSNSTFNECIIANNEAQNSALYFFFSNATLHSCSFYDNYSPEGGATIASSFASLSISNSTFSNSNSFLQSKYGSQTNWPLLSLEGHFINLISGGVLSLTDSSFENGVGEGGSAISANSGSSLIVDSCSFTSNFGEEGAIRATSAELVSLNGSSFVRNIGSVSDISMYRVKNATISETLFSTSEGSIIDTYKSSLYLKQNNITANSNSESELLIVREANSVSIQSNSFSNLIAKRVIRVQDSSLISASIASNAFTNITSQASSWDNSTTIAPASASPWGLAILISSSSGIAIESNNFTKITLPTSLVSSQGAGLFVDSLSQAISISQNSFSNCTAKMGGAISYKSKQVTFLDNTFSQNKAPQYGPNIAAFPSSLEIRSYNQLPTNYQTKFPRNLMSEQDSKGITPFRYLQTISNVKSGGKIANFYVVLLDDLGQVVSSETGSYLQLKISSNSTLFNPQIQLNQAITSKLGVFDVTKAIFRNEPNTPALVAISTAAIESTYSLTVTMEFRKCVEGEGYSFDGRCLTCQANRYKFIAEDTPTGCHECPNNAVCYGSNLVTPAPGYWRSDAYSISFLPCYTPGACLGSTLDDYNPIGHCHTGYRGILCAQCDPGYVRNANFQCAKCPSQVNNILLLSFVLLVAGASIILLIKVTLSTMAQKSSVFSVFFKILANHLQLVLLVLSFELDWPSSVQSLSDVIRPVADVASRVISLDCFLGTGEDESLNNVYIYLLVYILTPLILLGLSFTFWCLKYRRQRNLAISRALTTIVILYFLLHPAITKTVFSIFHCRSIDSDSRLILDLDIVCYQGSHLMWALLAGGFGLLLWVAGIPLVSWCILKQNQSILEAPYMKERFGFLYKGYRQKKYFWEVVVMLRKVVMIFISVFLRSVGTRVQAFSVFLLLLFFVVLTISHRPYVTRQLNSLEVYSLITSCITIYAGFFFLSQLDPAASYFEPGKDFSLTHSWKWVFFALILLSNLLFLTVWFVALFSEVRGTCRTKFPSFYLACCLCYRRHLYQRELKAQKAVDMNQNLISEIDEVIDTLKLAKRKVVERSIFQDWKKFLIFIHSAARNLAKTNFEDINSLEKGSQGKYRIKPAKEANFDRPPELPEMLDFEEKFDDSAVVLFAGNDAYETNQTHGRGDTLTGLLSNTWTQHEEGVGDLKGKGRKRSSLKQSFESSKTLDKRRQSSLRAPRSNTLRKTKTGVKDIVEVVKEEEDILDFFKKEDAGAQTTVALIDFPVLRRSAQTIGSAWKKKNSKRSSKYQNIYGSLTAKAERLRKMKSAEHNAGRGKIAENIHESGILEEIMKPEKTERIVLNQSEFRSQDMIPQENPKKEEEEKCNRIEANSIQAMFYPQEQEEQEVDNEVEQEYSQELRMARTKKFNSRGSLAESGSRQDQDLMNEILNL